MIYGGASYGSVTYGGTAGEGFVPVIIDVSDTLTLTEDIDILHIPVFTVNVADTLTLTEDINIQTFTPIPFTVTDGIGLEDSAVVAERMPWRFNDKPSESTISFKDKPAESTITFKDKPSDTWTFKDK
jgi:hypothetical protein